jgi:nucleoside diphosphate-linked moiety X motif protein 19
MMNESLTLVNHRNAGNPDQDFLPTDVAYRITAIRETFEETGVLLLTHPDRDVSGHPLSDMDDMQLDLSVWREKVRKDGSAFIDLCVETGLCPDLWLLKEWSNWLTPISVGHKRFDTMFYMCCLDKQPKVVLDQTEVTTLKVCVIFVLLILLVLTVLSSL